MEEQGTQVEQQPEVTPEVGAAQTTPDGAINTETRRAQQQSETVPYARFQEVVRERNQLQERVRAIEAQTQAAASGTSQAAAPDVAALYEQAQAQIAQLQAQIEELGQVRTAVQEQLGRRLERVPQHIRDLLEGMEPVKAMAWLEANEEQLAPRQAPETDAGKVGERGGKRPVTVKPLGW